MSAALIAALTTSAVAIIGAVFTGLAQLRHQQTQHGNDGQGQAAAPTVPQQRPTPGP